MYILQLAAVTYVKRLLAAKLANWHELDQLSTLSAYFQSGDMLSSHQSYNTATVTLLAPRWTAAASTRRESAFCRLNSDCPARIGTRPHASPGMKMDFLSHAENGGSIRHRRKQFSGSNHPARVLETRSPCCHRKLCLYY